jgi:hypothetical protein
MAVRISAPLAWDPALAGPLLHGRTVERQIDTFLPESIPAGASSR